MRVLHIDLAIEDMYLQNITPCHAVLSEGENIKFYVSNVFFQCIKIQIKGFQEDVPLILKSYHAN